MGPPDNIFFLKNYDYFCVLHPLLCEIKLIQHFWSFKITLIHSLKQMSRTLVGGKWYPGQVIKEPGHVVQKYCIYFEILWFDSSWVQQYSGYWHINHFLDRFKICLFLLVLISGKLLQWCRWQRCQIWQPSVSEWYLHHLHHVHVDRGGRCCPGRQEGGGHWL